MQIYLHYLSIKESLYYSANHTYISMGFEWVLHDEIVAFITSGAVQNDKKLTLRKKMTKYFVLLLLLLFLNTFKIIRKYFLSSLD